MTDGGKKFLWGIAVGVAAAAFLKTDTFRKGCARIIAGGMQVKNDAKEYFETIKEDAEDIRAEQDSKANS